MLKRLVDFLFSFMGLVLLTPVLAIIALLIILDSKGPILYKQIRVGKNNADFRLLKFRTMGVDSDKIGLLTVGRDSRITRVGYWLRKYKIDEIPQLINVLVGEMSLVGPRPEVRKYVELYTPEQLMVLSVKPGITDWASIQFSEENALLGEASDAEQLYIKDIMPLKLKLNIEYVRNNDLLTDLKIIITTIRKILSH